MESDSTDVNIVQPAEPSPSPNPTSKLSKSKVKARNMKFLGASLALLVVLFALVAGIMHRQPQNSQSEVKQKEYNEEFNSLTPSTSYIRMPEDDQEALEAIPVNELDPEFKTLDEAVDSL